MEDEYIKRNLETPCSSMVGSGMYSGILLGASYGIYIGTLEILKSPWEKGLIKNLGKQSLVVTAGMATILATFNGVECGMKTLRGKKDFINPAAAGFVVGSIYGAAVTRSPAGTLKLAVIVAAFGSAMGMAAK